MTSISKKASALAFLFFISIEIFAHRVSFEGFSNSVFIDLPEEFALVQSQGEDSFLLQSKVAPVSSIIKIYKKEKFISAQEALGITIQKLNLKTLETKTAQWRNNEACIAAIKGKISGAESQGYAAASVIPENKSIAVLISWCGAENFNNANFLIESFIDSLCIDSESCFSPGLFTSLYHPASGNEQTLNLLIDKKEISTQLDSLDCKNSEYLIEREYKVLQMYMNSPLWKEAWQRYYRMIFKDSCKRLQKVSFDIYRTLAPDCKDETDFAQKILSWTQGFKYEREKTASDFVSLPSIISGGGSDCDSRAMLIAVILQSMNIDSIIFVSSEFHHAIAGLVSSHPGFVFTVDGKTYLTGETTVPGLTWGIIDKNQSDFSKWIPVMLP